MVRMIVYVLFFIVLWSALKKNTENKDFVNLGFPA